MEKLKSGKVSNSVSDRRPAGEIVQGLTTTADKIRALAKAGYDRSEIKAKLGISYQHVRNVLVRSGISGGLRRGIEAEREPVEVDAAPAPREDTSWTMLTESGFQYLGDWTLDSQAAIRLEANAPNEPGVYAFIVDDVVVYVGLTLRSLRGRFDQYRRGHQRQKTSARIKRRIQEALKNSKPVKVLIALPEPLSWPDLATSAKTGTQTGLPVNTSAGLEAGLIEMIRPPWNIRGAQ